MSQSPIIITDDAEEEEVYDEEDDNGMEEDDDNITLDACHSPINILHDCNVVSDPQFAHEREIGSFMYKKKPQPAKKRKTCKKKLIFADSSIPGELLTKSK